MNWQLVCMALIPGVLCGTGAPQAAQEPTAARLIKAAGVQGGLVVHLGCGDGGTTAALRADDRYVVHGLDTSAENVEAARRRMASLGLSGPVTIDCFDGKSLPYVDNLVNLVVADGLGEVPMSEVMRVLAPEGVAMIGGRKTVKPRPEDIDEWTHYLYDAGGNAVSQDRRVGSPRHLQWTAGPNWTRDHDALASISAMTTSKGRLFYIIDEGPTSLIHRPAEWKLVARDAFNGVLLWKREIPRWVTHLHYFRSGPTQATRRLVSVGDRVYGTLGWNAPVSMLNAADGQTVLQYAGSENTEEIVWHQGTLLVVVGEPEIINEEAPKVFGYWELSVDRELELEKSIVAYDAASGKIRWRKAGAHLSRLVPLSLCAEGERVFFLCGEKLHCLALEDGRELWQAAFPTEGLFLRNYAPTVVACQGVVMCLTWDRLHAFSMEDGRRMWAHNQGSIGFAAMGDLLVAGGVAWTIPQTAAIWRGNKLDRRGRIASGVPIPREHFLGQGGRQIVGIDIRSGKVAGTIPQDQVLPGGHHHRCYRNKATERYLICGRRGLEFLSLESDEYVNNWWVRGICQYGVMPANGLIYVPPDPCQCFSQIKVNGLLAMSAESSPDGLAPAGRGDLEKGPVYEEVTGRSSSGARAVRTGDLPAGVGGPGWLPPVSPDRPDEWPTYRANISRSGSTPAALPAHLEKRWQAEIGGELTACVVAEEKLLVCDKNTNTIRCLDAATGEVQWTHIAGGPVDSPPTVYDGLCLFGCRDGTVSCLRLSDGKLVWRFRSPPVDRRVVAESRLESIWPIHGSVLVDNGVAYFAAGRSSYLDGGIYLFGLDARSGRQLYRTLVSTKSAVSGKTSSSPPSGGALPDVLVSDGRTISMRSLCFDNELRLQSQSSPGTLTSDTGFLEDSWFHRQSWALPIRAEGEPHARAFSGKLIAFDEQCAFSVSNPYTWLKRTPAMYPPSHDGHLHQKYSRYRPEDFPIGVRIAGIRRGADSEPSPQGIWALDEPFQVRSMILAGEILFLAGWRDAVAVEPKTGHPLNPQHHDPRPAMLRAVAAASGETLAEYPLESEPVFDGMAAAYGRLYLPLKSGSVICLGAE